MARPVAPTRPTGAPALSGPVLAAVLGLVACGGGSGVSGSSNGGGGVSNPTPPASVTYPADADVDVDVDVVGYQYNPTWNRRIPMIWKNGQPATLGIADTYSEALGIFILRG